MATNNSPIIKAKKDIKSSLTSYFVEADFTNVKPGTPEHAIINIFTELLYGKQEELQQKHNSLMPLEATGAPLDLWSIFLGTQRTAELYAADSTTNNVHFFVSDANRALVSSDLVIPVGTTITNINGAKIYETTEQVTLPNTSPSVIYVPVIAKNSGAFQNVEANELVLHTIEGVTPTEEEYIEVTNSFAITSGQSTQSDEDLAMDLQDIFGEALRTNEEGIKAKVSLLPGVALATIIPAKRGTGTFNVFLDTTTPVISPHLIETAQKLVDVEAALGVKGYVDYPVYKAISLTFEVLPKDGVDNTSLLASLEQATTSSIRDSVNNIGRGETIDPNVLLRIVLDHEDILNAKIRELKVGEYSVLNNKVINSVGIGLGKKSLTDFEKWFTSDNLITFCIATYE